MVTKVVILLGYTCEYEPLFYNHLRPLSSLDDGLYPLACEEDVRCLATLVRSFKLVEVYIEHGFTVVNSYQRPPPQVRATIEDISQPCTSATIKEKFDKMLMLTWHDSTTPVKYFVYNFVTPRLCLSMILVHMLRILFVTPRSLPHGVDIQDHALPTIQSQFSAINLSFVLVEPTTNKMIADVIRQLSYDEIDMEGEACFGDVAGSGTHSFGLSRDEYFRVHDLDLNKNLTLDLKMVVFRKMVVVSKIVVVRKMLKRLVVNKSIVMLMGSTVHMKLNIMLSLVKMHVQMMMIMTMMILFVDEENEMVEPDVDVHLFGISKDVPFENIDVTSLVSKDVDVVNLDGFDSEHGNDDETTTYRRRSPTEAKDKVYPHFIESRRMLKLYKNDMIRTYTLYETLLNELANDGVSLSKHEINVGFVNSLLKKWITFSQRLRNANHTQTLDLADIYGRFVYEDNLIQRRYSDAKKALITTPSSTVISTAFFSNNVIQDFQENSDDEVDERSSEEYLRDLDIEYHERALLVNSKLLGPTGSICSHCQ
nr:retrovirus-related Pol polyprotein from transposon TNT 1-94 [Tanacetum cinerariifolium]